MKNLKYLLIATALTISSVSQANWFTTAIDYGLPCLIGAGLGAALGDGSKNKTAIGASICGAVSMSTYLNQQRSKTEMQDEDFKKFVKLMNERVDEKGVELEKKQQAELVELKQLMKEVMAERMASIEGEMKENVKTYLENNEFMKDVEYKFMKKIREYVVSESKARQKETVNQCIDEALEQIVKKKYGTSKDEIVD